MSSSCSLPTDTAETDSAVIVENEKDQAETMANTRTTKTTKTTTPNNATDPPPATPSDASTMIQACTSGNIALVRQLLLSHTTTNNNNAIPYATPATLQDEETGTSPLIAAGRAGHVAICELLLEEGAPWNAVDRKGKCAGNYATEGGYWEVVDLLVDAGTRAELILGAAIRISMEGRKEVVSVSDVDSNKPSNYNDDSNDDNNNSNKDNNNNNACQQQSPPPPVEHEPCTKPDYLQRNVRYNASQTALLDSDGDAVMMEWERPLMDAHASILISNDNNKSNHKNDAPQQTTGKRILNVGFGMGIIDTALQRHNPSLHVIIEAHPLVHRKMIDDGWDKKNNVQIRFGRWQDVVPALIEEGTTFDGVFYDTYGEHFTDLEDFQGSLGEILVKPGGVYSFFNGLAPDNLFFHGVACQCVKLQLAKLGLDSEFAACEIKVDEGAWDGVRRKYWHGQTYYLPIVTWNADFLNPTKKQRLN